MTVIAPDKSRIFAHTVAVRLGEALLIGFAVVILLAGIDRSQRRDLETYQEVSAVGDRAFFPIPEQQPKPPTPVAVFQNHQLVPVSYERVEIRDTRLIRLGKDESGQYSVYRIREGVGPEKGKNEPKADKFLYLKVAPDEYLKTLQVGVGK